MLIRLDRIIVIGPKQTIQQRLSTDTRDDMMFISSMYGSRETVKIIGKGCAACCGVMTKSIASLEHKNRAV